RLAVRRVKDGAAPSAVIKSYGLCRTTIYKWLTAERRGGAAALTARKHPGRKPALAPRQKLQVRRWINGKDPRQYGFDFGLWTRQIVAALLAQKFGVRLGVTAVGRLLAELDITPQKPLRRAYERDPDLRRQRARRLLVRDLHRAAQRSALHRIADALHARSEASGVPRPRRPPRPHRQRGRAVRPAARWSPRVAFPAGLRARVEPR